MGGGGGGGHSNWRLYQMREKTREIEFFRDGHGTRGLRKSCQNRNKNGRKWNPNCYDHSSRRGRVGR